MSKPYQVLESYYAGAYWGPRKEKPGECAKRLQIFLDNLPTVDPIFSHWFRQGRTRKDALSKPIKPDHKALEESLRRSVDRHFKNLGCSIWAWNGVCVDYDDSGFNIQCGGYFEHLSNVCVFKLPTRGPHADRILTGHTLARLVKSMVLAWEPESAISTSTVHREMVTDRAGADTFVGWVMYFPLSQGPIPLLPEPVRTEPVEGRGTLVILTPERFTAANPEHVALAARVQELLRSAGLLRPEPPHP